MSRRTRQLITLGIAAMLLGGVAWLVARRPATVIYEGKTSREWALQILSVSVPDREQAMTAFKALGPAAVPELIQLLRAKDSVVRKPVWAFAEWLPSRQRRKVFATTGYDESRRLRRGAARALGVLGPAALASIPELVGLLRSPEYELRWEASGALGKMGKPAVAELVKTLGETNYETKEAAVGALGNIGPEAENAIPALKAAMDDSHPVVRGMAAYGLTAIGSPALPALMETLETGSEEAKAAARQGLDKMEPTLGASVPALIALTQDEKSAYRRYGLKALGRIRAGDAEAVAAMTRGLKDPDLPVQLAALEALGRVSRQAALAVPGLTLCLNSQSPAARRLAAQVLGKIGEPAKTAIPELSTLASDPEESVRVAANQTLQRLSRGLSQE